MNPAITIPRTQWNPRQYNPFYLLSAACMLAGCLALTNSLSWTEIPVSRLLILIGTLNIYEAALIGLAWFLLKHRALRRDGLELLGLEAFFLLDVTFLNAEIVTGHLNLGLAINIILFLVACLKMGIIWRLLDSKQMDARFAFIFLQIAALFALPAILRHIDQGWLSDRDFYLAWWEVAALVLVGDVMLRFSPSPETPSPMVRFFTVMPWLAIVLHQSILHYVYDVTFWAANATPLLLALAIMANRSERTAPMARADLTGLRVMLPTVAILASLANPEVLNIALGKSAILTPLKFSLGGTYLTYVYIFAGRFAVYFLITGALGLVGFIYGPTTQQLGNSLSDFWQRGFNLAYKCFPKTMEQWGATAIAAAFGFLGIGAAVSLKRKPDSSPAE